MRPFRAIAAALVLALAGTACFGRAPDPGKTFRAAEVTGEVQVRTGPDAAWEPVLSGLRIAPGSEVKTAGGGGVSLARDDGAKVDLGGDTVVAIRSVLLLTLDRGSVLASTDRVDLAVEASGVEARARKSVFRVDRSFAVRVGVYGGEVAVTRDTDRLAVPELRQIEVAGGIVPRDPAPLKFASTDPWDRQLLADVIDLDRQLRTFGRAFKADFASRVANPAFYASLLPGIPAATFAELITRTGDVADVLFGVVMTLRIGGTPDGILARLVQLRLDGATWGLIAKINGVAFRSYIDAVVAAVVPGSGTPSPRATGSGPGGGGPTPTPRPTGSGSPRPTGSPSTSPTPTPTPSDSASPTPSPCSDLDRLLGRCGTPAQLPGGVGATVNVLSVWLRLWR